MGDAAVKFAAEAGLFLDPWQQEVLRGSMGVVKGGKWAARNVGLLVPRQNGKGSVLEARELFGLFVLGEPLIIHSAHQFDTSQEHFLRMRDLIDGNPDLAKHVKPVGGFMTANGKESINLRNGCRLKFKARSSGSARGFSCDLLVLDEAMILSEKALAAMSPTSGARRNPQTWFTSSAGTPESDALWRLVERGRSKTKRLAYFEWGCSTGVDAADPANWAAANPGLGYRLPVDEIENEFLTLTADSFAREHLGIWDDQAANPMVRAWQARFSAVSDIAGLPTYSLEVSEDRKWACVAAAGDGPGGLNVTVGAYREGTAWVVDFLAELASRRSVRVVVQPSSPAGSLISELEARRVTVVRMSLEDYRAACGQFYDSVMDSGDICHGESKALDIAVREAEMKPSGDAWVWDRRTESTDISPLAAVTLAAWGSRQKPRAGRFMTF